MSNHGTETRAELGGTSGIRDLWSKIYDGNFPMPQELENKGTEEILVYLLERNKELTELVSSKNENLKLLEIENETLKSINKELVEREERVVLEPEITHLPDVTEGIVENEEVISELGEKLQTETKPLLDELKKVKIELRALTEQTKIAAKNAQPKESNPTVRDDQNSNEEVREYEPKMINEVVDLGVPRDQAKLSLEMSNWDVSKAVNVYFDILQKTGSSSPKRLLTRRGRRLRDKKYFSGFLQSIKEVEPATFGKKKKKPKPKPKEEEESITSTEPVNSSVYNDYERSFSDGVITVRFSLPVPRILPPPQTEEEYQKRFDLYNGGKEKRKALFTKRTLSGFHEARMEYMNVLTHVFFVATSSFTDLKKSLPSYSFDKHAINLRKLIICLRKIAECDYFLGLFDEAMSVCNTNFEIFELHKLHSKYSSKEGNKIMRFTLGVMGKVMIAKKRFDEASNFINLARELNMSSPTLMRTEEELSRCFSSGGTVSQDDERSVLVSKSKDLIFETFPIRFPLGEFFVDGFDELLKERVEYVLNFMDKKMMNRMNGLMFTIQKKNWKDKNVVMFCKSLIC